MSYLLDIFCELAGPSSQHILFLFIHAYLYNRSLLILPAYINTHRNMKNILNTILSICKSLMRLVYISTHTNMKNILITL